MSQNDLLKFMDNYYENMMIKYKRYGDELTLYFGDLKEELKLSEIPDIFIKEYIHEMSNLHKTEIRRFKIDVFKETLIKRRFNKIDKIISNIV